MIKLTKSIENLFERIALIKRKSTLLTGTVCTALKKRVGHDLRKAKDKNLSILGLESPSRVRHIVDLPSTW